MLSLSRVTTRTAPRLRPINTVPLRYYHYDTLGVERDASLREIRAAFKIKSVECHPDKYPGNLTKERTFKLLNEAYQILSAVEERAKYDEATPDPSTRHEGRAEAEIFTPENIGAVMQSATGLANLRRELFNAKGVTKLYGLLAQSNSGLQGILQSRKSAEVLTDILIAFGSDRPRLVGHLATILRKLSRDDTLEKLIKDPVSATLLTEIVKIARFEQSVLEPAFRALLASLESSISQIVSQEAPGKLMANILQFCSEEQNSALVATMSSKSDRLYDVCSEKYGAILWTHVIQSKWASMGVIESVSRLILSDIDQYVLHESRHIVLKAILNRLGHEHTMKSATIFSDLADELSKGIIDENAKTGFLDWAGLAQHRSGSKLVIEILDILAYRPDIATDLTDQIINNLIDNMSAIVRDTTGSTVFQKMFHKFPECQDEILGRIDLDLDGGASVYTKEGSQAIQAMQETKIGCEMLYPFFRTFLGEPIRDNNQHAVRASEKQIQQLHYFQLYEEHNDLIDMYCNTMGTQLRRKATRMRKNKYEEEAQFQARSQKRGNVGEDEDFVDQTAFEAGGGLGSTAKSIRGTFGRLGTRSRRDQEDAEYLFNQMRSFDSPVSNVKFNTNEKIDSWDWLEEHSTPHPTVVQSFEEAPTETHSKEQPALNSNRSNDPFESEFAVKS